MFYNGKGLGFESGEPLLQNVTKLVSYQNIIKLFCRKCRTMLHGLMQPHAGAETFVQKDKKNRRQKELDGGI